MILLYFVVSICAGISVVLARIINAKLAEKTCTLEGTVVNYITGLIISIIVLLFSKEMKSISLAEGKTLPIWAYLGGLVGIAVILGSNYITTKISAFYLALLLFIGQLFVGLIIDYFLYGELPSGKLLGGIFVLAGLTYNLWIDKNQDIKDQENKE